MIYKIKPLPGQESVWDYPRPPRLERTNKQITIHFNNKIIADTQKAFRILETSHPPVYYLPPEDIKMEFLHPADGISYCEWKGSASYYNVVVDEKFAVKAAWYYPNPVETFLEIRDYIAFYPWKMDSCFVNGERVLPQPGNFYGGWITKDITGPFKGEPDSYGW